MRVRYITGMAAWFLVAAACNNSEWVANQSASDSTALTPVPVTADTVIAGCYTQVSNKDTATLQLQVKGSNITGPLSYSIFQKDRNDGTVQVELIKGVVMGWYLFRSEGVMSVRQVAWEIHGDQLWPAVGDMQERNDSAYFRDPASLHFDSTRPFRKIACVM